jgi:hypothetical protein
MSGQTYDLMRKTCHCDFHTLIAMDPDLAKIPPRSFFAELHIESSLAVRKLLQD